MSMTNILEIRGHKTVISYDPDANLFRGEFLGLNGGADFYGDSIAQLVEEGERSLQAFLDVCKERGIDPIKQFSGKFQLRLKREIHEKAAVVAAARGVSLNALIEEAIEHELEEVA